MIKNHIMIIYLLIVNILGFAFFAINTWLYSNTEDGQIDVLLTIDSLLGGSLGIVLAIFIIDRKAVKENMMSRVFVFCVLIIQVIALLMLKGPHQGEITFAIWEFFDKHKVVIIYLFFINIITAIAFGIDKMRAIQGRWRIRIVTLLGLAFAGGSIGALLAMYSFRHKNKQDYFAIGVPLILVMQIVVIFYLTNL